MTDVSYDTKVAGIMRDNYSNYILVNVISSLTYNIVVMASVKRLVSQVLSATRRFGDDFNVKYVGGTFITEITKL